MKLLQYKGYYGSIEASIEDDCLYGKLEFIDPLVNFEGSNVKELDRAFKEAVDDYLVDCENLDREPSKPYKGSFNVRIGANLHKQAVISAREQDVNLNEFVKHSIEQAVNR